MNQALLASHLGFTTWKALVEASERVTSADGHVWYVTETPTWYKWVLWNTDGDVWFHYRSRASAIQALAPSHVTL